MESRELNRVSVCVTLLAIALIAETHAGENWPSFQNGGEVSLPAENSLPLQWGEANPPKWIAKLEGYGQSSPIIWSDRVYVTSCAGENKDSLLVVALNSATGERLWKHELTNSSPEEMTGYVSKAAPTPVANAAGVIAFFEGGNIVALDHEGNERWSRDLPADYGPIQVRHGLAASLEQDDEHIFVWIERAEEPYILAIDKRTGETIWKVAGVGNTSWSSPRLVPVGDAQHLVLSAIGRIVGLDPSSGARLWELGDVANNSSATPIPLGEGRFLVGASDGRGEAPAGGLNSNGVVRIVPQADGTFEAKYLWRAKRARVSFGSPIATNAHAYFVNRSGVVYCHHLETGDEIFAKRTAESVWATPLHVGKRIYFFGRGGTTTILRTGPEFEVIAVNQLPDSTQTGGNESTTNTNGPPTAPSGNVVYAAAVSDGQIFLRRGDRLYCIGE